METILIHIQNDQYYPLLIDKAAYLFVSIIEGHIYSNGNKRLAVVALLFFLFINKHNLIGEMNELYGLCLYVADKRKNQDANFDMLKQYVRDYLERRMQLDPEL